MKQLQSHNLDKTDKTDNERDKVDNDRNYCQCSGVQEGYLKNALEDIKSMNGSPKLKNSSSEERRNEILKYMLCPKECPRFHIANVLSVNTLDKEKQNANYKAKTCINTFDVEKSLCDVPLCPSKNLSTYVECDLNCCCTEETNTFTVWTVEDKHRPASFVRKRKLRKESADVADKSEFEQADKSRPASFIRKRNQKKDSIKMSYEYEALPGVYTCQPCSGKIPAPPETSSTVSRSSTIQFCDDVDDPDNTLVRSRKSIIKNQENPQDANKGTKSCIAGPIVPFKEKDVEPCVLCNRTNEDIQTICGNCRTTIIKLNLYVQQTTQNTTKEGDNCGTFVTTCSICNMIYESSSFCDVCCHCKETLEGLGEKTENFGPCNPCIEARQQCTVKQEPADKTNIQQEKKEILYGCKCETPRRANKQEKREDLENVIEARQQSKSITAVKESKSFVRREQTYKENFVSYNQATEARQYKCNKEEQARPFEQTNKSKTNIAQDKIVQARIEKIDTVFGFNCSTPNKQENTKNIKCEEIEPKICEPCEKKLKKDVREEIEICRPCDREIHKSSIKQDKQENVVSYHSTTEARQCKYNKEEQVSERPKGFEQTNKSKTNIPQDKIVQAKIEKIDTVFGFNCPTPNKQEITKNIKCEEIEPKICEPCEKKLKKDAGEEIEICRPCDREIHKSPIKQDQIDKPESKHEKSEIQFADCNCKEETVSIPDVCYPCDMEIYTCYPKKEQMDKTKPKQEKLKLTISTTKENISTFYECQCGHNKTPQEIPNKEETTFIKQDDSKCSCGRKNCLDDSNRNCIDCGSTFQIDENQNVCESCKIRFIFRKLGILKNEEDKATDSYYLATPSKNNKTFACKNIETQTSKYQPIMSKKCKSCNLYFEVNLTDDLCIPCRVKPAKQTEEQDERECECDSESELLCECSESDGESSLGTEDSCTCVKDEYLLYKSASEVKNYCELATRKCLEQSARLSQCISNCREKYSNFITQQYNSPPPNPFVTKTIPCQVIESETREHKPRKDCVEIIKSQLKHANGLSQWSKCRCPSNIPRNFCATQEHVSTPARSSSKPGRIVNLTTQLPPTTVSPVVFRKSCKNLSAASGTSIISHEEESRSRTYHK